MIECTKCGVGPAAIVFDTAKPSEVLCVDCAREALFEKCTRTPSDINEHLPLLRALAAGCSTVIEFGLRWARGSTVAFLAAQPKNLISWDIDAECVLDQKVMDLYRLRGKTFFQPRVGDTLEIPPERCDLLFLDSLHTAKQLLAELMRHSDPGARRGDTTSRPVRKYLVFHDTSTFGMTGEDGSSPGLLGAIRHYQRNEAFPLWEVMALAQVKGLGAAESARIAEHAERRRDGEAILNLPNNNGLVVLRYICSDGHAAPTASGQCGVCSEWIER